MSTGDDDRTQGRRDEGDGEETVAIPATAADPVDPSSAADPEVPRRRTPLLVAGAIALVLVAALVVWLATRGDEPTITGPGPTTSSTGAPTGTPTDAGTSTSPGDAPGSTSATSSAAAQPVPTTIPDGLVLPAEGEDGWVARGWTYQPCGTQVSAAGTSDFRRIAVDGPDDSRHQTLLAFPTADAATAFIGGMRTAAEECAGPGDALTDTPAVSVGTLEGDWAESVLSVQSYPLPEGGYSPGGDYTLAVRQGSAVAVSGGYAEWAPGYPDPDPAALAEYRAALDDLAPELCVFAADGC